MLFSVPIRNNSTTTECLDLTMSSDERTKLFGQWDHMRIFGDEDALDILSGAEDVNVNLVNPFEWLTSEELEAAFIPKSVQVLSGHSIFEITSK